MDEEEQYEEEQYRRQLKMSHSTPPEYSKIGPQMECYCIKCNHKCTEDTKACPNCHSTEIKYLYSTI